MACFLQYVNDEEYFSDSFYCENPSTGALMSLGGEGQSHDSGDK